MLANAQRQNVRMIKIVNHFKPVLIENVMRKHVQEKDNAGMNMQNHNIFSKEYNAAV